jgi:hypothetical protein
MISHLRGLEIEELTMEGREGSLREGEPWGAALLTLGRSGHQRVSFEVVTTG